MQKPITDHEMKHMIYASFPNEMIPYDLFLPEASCDDISDVLQTTFLGKGWTEIEIYDWRMTGVRVSVIVRYFKSKVFAYYMPSLLISSVNDKNFDYSLDAVLPSNMCREPHGAWWQEYVGSFDASQSKAITIFLQYVRFFSPEGSPDKMQAEQALESRLF